MYQPSEQTRTLRELPPRRLDWYSQAVLLFGDFISQTGWALLAAGSVFFWTTAVNSEVKIKWQEHTVEWQEKAGVILAADSLDAQEGGQHIWKYRHSFALEGRRFLGESYSVGKKFDAGQIAYIRYDASRPGVNNIIGLRRSPYSWRVNLLLLIPALGGVFVLYPLRQNLRFLRLLKIGDFARGRLVEKNTTGRSLRRGGSEHPVLKYRFEFQHNGALFNATCQTSHTNLVEDESTEIILFDRYHPIRNLVFDAVPNAPVISEDGKLKKSPPERCWVLFFPAFTVAVNFVFLLLS